MSKLRIFSGVQPSGNLHIGNYLGAISQWVEMQDEYESIFCVVDYHAITVPQKPSELKEKIIEIAKLYLAAGIDPKKSVIFQQSDIKEHTELGWVLNCIANAGEIKRMTQFNDKTGIVSLDKQINQYEKFLTKEVEIYVSELRSSTEKKITENYDIKKIKSCINDDKKLGNLLTELVVDVMQITSKNASKYFGNAEQGLIKIIEDENSKFNKSNVALFDYPVLMAADILLYNTDAVPVGEDQKQHVELTRDLAKRFNNAYGETFRLPKAVIRKEGARIMGLDDPTKKMSKSAASESNYIAFTDDPAKAAKKIMKATTDSGAEVEYDPEKKPGISNLLVIQSLLTKKDIKILVKENKGKMYGDFKKSVAETVKEFLIDFQARYNKISNNDVRNIMKQGVEKIQPIAQETINRVKERIGVR